MKRALFVAGLWVVLLSPRLHAQAIRRVDVRVTFVSGQSVFLDRGRDAGIAPGDQLVLRPPGRDAVTARIAAVSKSSSRAELALAPGLLSSGISGEVLVPEDRLEPSPDQVPAPASKKTPDHPPWEARVPGAGADVPLLAPAEAETARRTSFRGRLYANALGTFDRGSDRDRRFLVARTGTELLAENVFSGSDQLHFDGELSRREARLDDAPDFAEDRARLDRLSYSFGLTEGAPVRGQVGRFPHAEVPELGLLDGAEASVPAGALGRIGASAGALPEPFHNGGSGDRFSTSLFWRADPGEDFATAFAYQRTWFHGERDRDLFLATTDAKVGDELFLHGSAWVDLYGGSDSIKSSGLELTELHLQASWLPGPGWALDASWSRIRWPELLLDEFPPLPPDRIRASRVDRVGAGVSRDLSATWRVSARVFGFEDESTDGIGGEARVSARDLLLSGGDVAVTVYRMAGSFVSGPGLRLSAGQRIGATFATLAYDVGLFENEGLSERSYELTQHAVTATLDFVPAPRWNISLSADSRFGDGQESITLGIFVQTRF